MMASLSCFYINCSHPGAITILMWQNGVILLNYRGGFIGRLQSPPTVRELVRRLLFRFSSSVGCCDGQKAVHRTEMKPSHQHPTSPSLCQAGAPGLPGHPALGEPVLHWTAGVGCGGSDTHLHAGDAVTGSRRLRSGSGNPSPSPLGRILPLSPGLRPECSSRGQHPSSGWAVPSAVSSSGGDPARLWPRHPSSRCPQALPEPLSRAHLCSGSRSRCHELCPRLAGSWDGRRQLAFHVLARRQPVKGPGGRPPRPCLSSAACAGRALSARRMLGFLPSSAAEGRARGACCRLPRLPPSGSRWLLVRCARQCRKAVTDPGHPSEPWPQEAHRGRDRVKWR